MKISSRAQLYSVGTKFIAGLALHQVALNLVHVLAAALLAALNAARGKESLYQTSRNGKRASVLAQQAAREAARKFCIKARDGLRPFLGTNWSEAWTQAGFKFQTLSLPTSLPGLVELTRSLKEYFTNHSPHENFNAEVTANIANAHLTALEGAIRTVSNCKRDQRGLREDRDAAQKVVLKLVNKLRSELDAALEPEDVRWLDFLEAIPADPRVPEAVEGVQVEGDAPGSVDVEWFPADRAERYHVEVQVAGLDTEFRRVATVTELNATVDNLPAGGRLKVRVVAANTAGTAPASDAVAAEVPAEVAA